MRNRVGMRLLQALVFVHLLAWFGAIAIAVLWMIAKLQAEPIMGLVVAYTVAGGFAWRRWVKI